MGFFQRNKCTIIGFVVVVFISFLPACSEKEKEVRRDAPRSGNVNREAADTINFPDGFSNVATKCDGPNRVYVAFKADQNRAAIAVVPNDPRCTG